MIPDFQTLMLPVLTRIAAGDIAFRDLSAKLSQEFSLSEEEQNRKLPSGNDRVFDNRIRWVIFHMKNADLLETPKRGVYAVTPEGRRLLAGAPASSDILRVCNQRRKSPPKKSANVQTEDADTTLSAEDHAAQEHHLTPYETIYQSYENIKTALADELLQRIRNMPPSFFEDILVKLLLAMGYGGLSEGEGRALGQSGDDGVDGVINQDLLGVDPLYIQAKRYAEDNKVGAAAIRDFYGALSLKKTQKGIFMTTSSFTTSAIQTVKDLDKHIILIDGAQLGELMYQYNVGCRDEEVLHLKKIDEDFFS